MLMLISNEMFGAEVKAWNVDFENSLYFIITAGLNYISLYSAFNICFQSQFRGAIIQTGYSVRRLNYFPVSNAFLYIEYCNSAFFLTSSNFLKKYGQLRTPSAKHCKEGKTYRTFANLAGRNFTRGIHTVVSQMVITSD